MRTFQVNKNGERVYCTDFWQHMELLPEGKYFVTVQKNRPKRSLPQNNYYWGGIVDPLAELTGYNKYVVHELLLKMFSYEMVEDFEGRLVAIPIRSSNKEKFTTKVAAEFYDNIREWSNDTLQFYLPTPEEWKKEQLKQSKNDV